MFPALRLDWSPFLILYSQGAVLQNASLVWAKLCIFSKLLPTMPSNSIPEPSHGRQGQRGEVISLHPQWPLGATWVLAGGIHPRQLPSPPPRNSPRTCSLETPPWTNLPGPWGPPTRSEAYHEGSYSTELLLMSLSNPKLALNLKQTMDLWISWQWAEVTVTDT